ncbi:interleukin-7 [Podarcis muralis]
MFHAFLRYIFGILPLFLALVPVGSSASMNAFLKKYEMFLSFNIRVLENQIGQNDGCNRSNTNRVFCNTMEVNTTGLEVFCNSALKRDIRDVACHLQKMTKRCNFTESVEKNMNEVSGMTLVMLKDCNNNTGIKRQRGNPCPNVRYIKRLCRECLIKDITFQFKLCWDQLMSHWT